MTVSEKYLEAMDREKLFENSEHRTRFKELLDCFSEYPFFTNRLCKCMYLSAWDNEHFAIMLQTLNDMVIGKERDTEDMRFQGELLAEEHVDGEYYVYQLSNAFLDGRKFLPVEYLHAQPEFRYIIERALKAEEVIDRVWKK